MTNRESRFAFGRNWRSFLGRLDEGRVAEAERSLREALGCESLDGRRFLDAGSGSGLFSLAARRLGAEVLSFDYDADSVRCTEALREKFFPGDARWGVLQGSVLDEAFLRSLGEFDVVYSWGVLHHTGDLRRAMASIRTVVKNGGRLFVAIYNDQGWKTAFWKGVKRAYCSGFLGRAFILAAFVPYFVSSGLLKDALRLRSPLRRYRDYRKDRGMSLLHDWVDWLGGWPFEAARPEEVFLDFRRRGFALDWLKINRGRGCNEFVFTREP